MKKVRFVQFIPHILLVILLIISMSGIPTWIQVLVLIYAGWRFFVLAAGGFGCTHCWMRFATAAMLLAFVIIQLSAKFYIVAFFLIGIDILTQLFMEEKSTSVHAF